MWKLAYRRGKAKPILCLLSLQSVLRGVCAQVLEHVCQPASAWHGRALPKALGLLPCLPAVRPGVVGAGDRVHQGRVPLDRWHLGKNGLWQLLKKALDSFQPCCSLSSAMHLPTKQR